MNGGDSSVFVAQTWPGQVKTPCLLLQAPCVSSPAQETELSVSQDAAA